MGFGVSLILAAAGAVLIWAVNASVSGVNVHTIGWILLIVGIIGFLITLVFLSDSAPWNRRRTVVEPTTYRNYDDPRVP